MGIVYIQKEQVDHINLINDTGSALSQYELTVIGGKVCIADEAILDSARGSFHNEDKLLVQIDATNDGVAGELTFGTANADVFWKSSTGEFSDTSTDGYYKIGTVNTVKDSGGIVLVNLMENAELISTQTATNTAAIGTLASLTTTEKGSLVGAINEVDADVATNAGDIASLEAEPRILVQKITADASAGIAVSGLSEGDEVVGMYVIATVSETNGAVQLKDASANAISDAIACAVDTTLTVASTIDDAYSTIPAGGASLVATGDTAANTRGIVVITYIPA